ncbi:MAG: hypothetical protein IJ662_08015 [Clostridia bacterium]|nr:hypothetical protein [Clostridia bacterium]
MDTDKTSPFSALSFQEQQDRWLEWRSRQLAFQEGPVIDSEAAAPSPSALPPVDLPHWNAAPTRHQNLDHVLSRHDQARKQHGAFQGVTSPSGSAQ